MFDGRHLPEVLRSCGLGSFVAWFALLGLLAVQGTPSVQHADSLEWQNEACDDDEVVALQLPRSAVGSLRSSDRQSRGPSHFHEVAASPNLQRPDSQQQHGASHAVGLGRAANSSAENEWLSNFRRAADEQRRSTAAVESQVAQSRRELSLLQQQLDADNSMRWRGPLSVAFEKATGAVAAAEGSVSVGQGTPAPVEDNVAESTILPSSNASNTSETGTPAPIAHRWRRRLNPVHLATSFFESTTGRLATVVFTFGVVVVLSLQFSKGLVRESDGKARARTILYHKDSDDGCVESFMKGGVNLCTQVVCDFSLRTRVLFVIFTVAWWAGLSLLWRWHFLQPILNQLVMVLLFTSFIVTVVLLVLAETLIIVSEEMKGAFHFINHIRKQMDQVLGFLGFGGHEDDDDDDDDDDDAPKVAS